MMIKSTAIAQHLKKKLSSVYILTGQDHYLFNEAIVNIKNAWSQRGECDTQRMHLNTADDWHLLIESANSYSLFADLVLIDAHYDKKSFDNPAKNALKTYLDNFNPRCLIILRAMAIPTKAMQWIAAHERVTIVNAQALTALALQQWIGAQLRSRGLKYEASIPALIHQYNQHNMLACAQVVEKLVLLNVGTETLTPEKIKAHLIEQSHYPLFELADACLSADIPKAISMLRQASQNRTEPTLILWILTQEIRQLIELSHLVKQSVSISSAINQLKIWSSRTKLYVSAQQRLSQQQLYVLLQQAQKIDECIKSNQNTQSWTMMEQLAFGFN